MFLICINVRVYIPTDWYTYVCLIDCMYSNSNAVHSYVLVLRVNVKSGNILKYKYHSLVQQSGPHLIECRCSTRRLPTARVAVTCPVCSHCRSVLGCTPRYLAASFVCNNRGISFLVGFTNVHVLYFLFSMG